MRFIGGIDPGVYHFAWARFVYFAQGWTLHDCGVREESDVPSRVWNCGEFVRGLDLERLAVEMPRVYRGKSKGDLNDLINLSITAGALGAGCVSTLAVAPRVWKGTMSKAVHHAKLLDKLHLTERHVLDHSLESLTKKRRLDLMDAVGIAAWLCGRGPK